MSYWAWGALGFLVGTAVAVRNARRTRVAYPFPLGVLLVVVALYAGLFGTKLLGVAIARPDVLREGDASALAFWEGGLAWQGFILAAPALAVVLKLAGRPVWLTLGSAAPGLALAHAISRLGCLSLGCCHGAPTELPWAIYSARLDAMVHPTQLYSLGIELAVFVLLQGLFDRRPALRSALLPGYVLLFACHRFVAGFARGDPPGPELIPGLRTDQAICLLYLVASLAALLALARPSRRLPSPDRAAEPGTGVGFEGGEIPRRGLPEWKKSRVQAAAGDRRKGGPR